MPHSFSHTGAGVSFLGHLAISTSTFMDYLRFSHFISIRWHTSWRSWPQLCFQCQCWAAGWASTSGSHCWFSWLEWPSCRFSAVSCLFLTNLNEKSHSTLSWKATEHALCGSSIWNNNRDCKPLVQSVVILSMLSLSIQVAFHVCTNLVGSFCTERNFVQFCWCPIKYVPILISNCVWSLISCSGHRRKRNFCVVVWRLNK